MTHGTVRCPECDKPLYRLTRPLVIGETIASASLFDPIGDMPGLVDGAPAPRCPIGHEWFGPWIHKPVVWS
jgi:hypothetical protein